MITLTNDNTPTWLALMTNATANTITAGLGSGVPATAVNQSYTVTVNREGESAVLTVAVNLPSAEVSAITASPSALAFGSFAAGYAQRPTQTITITNTGTANVVLDALPSVTGWTLTQGTDWTVEMQTGQTRTFTIRPNDGLTAGTYNPAITITGSGGASAQIQPTFTVTPPQVVDPGPGPGPGPTPSPNPTPSPTPNPSPSPTPSPTPNPTPSPTPQRFTISVSASPANGGTVSGGGTVNRDAAVTLRAAANSGWSFSGWYEGGTRVSSGATFRLTATSNRSIVAQFTQEAADPLPDSVSEPGTTIIDIGSSEVTVSDWAVEEIQRAYEIGLIPDSLILPSANDYTRSISRAEFAGIVVKTFESLTGSAAMPAVMNPFTDTSGSNLIDVLKAYNTGLMVGMSETTFEPNTVLNREMAATALTRVFKRATMPGWTFATDADFRLAFGRPAPFDDDANISDWAKDSVYFMASHNIIRGMGYVWGIGDNVFGPKNETPAHEAAGFATATREQALAIALRMVENLG